MSSAKPFVLSADGESVVPTPVVLEAVIGNTDKPLRMFEYEFSYKKRKPKPFCLQPTLFSKPVFVFTLAVALLLIIAVASTLGYFLNTKVAERVFTTSDYNGECLFTSQCVPNKGLVCTSRKCQCNGNTVYNGTMCGNKAGINATCVSSDTCDESKGLVCLNSKCVCYEYVQYYDSKSATCIDYAKENDPCQPERCNPYIGHVCKCPGSAMGSGCKKCEKV